MKLLSLAAATAIMALGPLSVEAASIKCETKNPARGTYVMSCSVLHPEKSVKPRSVVVLHNQLAQHLLNYTRKSRNITCGKQTAPLLHGRQKAYSILGPVAVWKTPAKTRRAYGIAAQRTCKRQYNSTKK